MRNTIVIYTLLFAVTAQVLAENELQVEEVNENKSSPPTTTKQIENTDDLSNESAKGLIQGESGSKMEDPSENLLKEMKQERKKLDIEIDKKGEELKAKMLELNKELQEYSKQRWDEYEKYKTQKQDEFKTGKLPEKQKHEINEEKKRIKVEIAKKKDELKAQITELIKEYKEFCKQKGKKWANIKIKKRNEFKQLLKLKKEKKRKMVSEKKKKEKKRKMVSEKKRKSGLKKNKELKNKLDKIVITKVQFQDTPLSEVLAWLQNQAQGDVPEDQRIRFVLAVSPSPPLAISINMKNLTMWEAVSYIQEATNLDFKSSDNGKVIIVNGEY